MHDFRPTATVFEKASTLSHGYVMFCICWIRPVVSFGRVVRYVVLPEKYNGESTGNVKYNAIRRQQDKCYFGHPCRFADSFMMAIERTIVFTAMPTIVPDLHGPAVMNRVYPIYLLTTAVTTPISVLSWYDPRVAVFRTCLCIRPCPDLAGNQICDQIEA